MDLLTEDIYRIREYLKGLQREALPGQFFEAQIPLRKEDARALIEEYGFQFLGIDQDIFSFRKWKGMARWEYALSGIIIPDDWVCGDFGCGRNPWPRANYLVDSSNCMEYAKPNQRFTQTTITQTLPFPDKFFDFVVCHHVLEHVNDPGAACREISRVAKRGLIEVPHALKDGLLLMYETDHRWHCFPPKKKGDPIQFKEVDRQWWDSMIDREAQIACDKIYLSGMDTMGPQAVLRNYFRRTEPNWNIIVPWEGKVEACIIG